MAGIATRVLDGSSMGLEFGGLKDVSERYLIQGATYLEARSATGLPKEGDRHPDVGGLRCRRISISAIAGSPDICYADCEFSNRDTYTGEEPPEDEDGVFFAWSYYTEKQDKIIPRLRKYRHSGLDQSGTFTEVFTWIQEDQVSPVTTVVFELQIRNYRSRSSSPIDDLPNATRVAGKVDEIHELNSLSLKFEGGRSQPVAIDREDITYTWRYDPGNYRVPPDDWFPEVGGVSTTIPANTIGTETLRWPFAAIPGATVRQTAQGDAYPMRPPHTVVDVYTPDPSGPDDQPLPVLIWTRDGVDVPSGHLGLTGING